ncbi:hypothetical protein [Ammoniphilus sp. YIM 78166]|uniref:hypothetical protein n=1 Tax=Ammoniphilus sp. YIM 78166 TaxID=1644106 RepID=UPI00106FA2CF|nr:hypothetical protein [Ammoniphilus sp. YIM 78166]
MYPWMDEVQQKYNLYIYRFQPTSQGIWMETNRGPTVMHAIPSPLVHKEELVQVTYRVMQHTGMVTPLLQSQEEKLVNTISGVPSYLMRWPAEESEWVDYEGLGEALAQFHLVSRYLERRESSSVQLGTWEQKWLKRLRNLYHSQRMAHRRAGRMIPLDSFLLQNFQLLTQSCQTALSYLQRVNYQELCSSCQTVGRIAYERFGHHQFIVTEHERVMFTDPFSWAEDTRARDIGNFIQDDVKEFGWNPKQIYSFISGYHRVSPLLPEEFYLMYAMFHMPERVMKKLEVAYNPPSSLFSFFSKENPELEQARFETESLTLQDMVADLKRNDTLIREFPAFLEQSFAVRL